jgi:hypothetical protein
VDVVILAGGRTDEALRAATGANYRADIVLAGRTLAERVLEATAPFGEPILVGGPEGRSLRRVEGGADFCESLGNGLARVESERFLLVTVDLPCLTTEGLRDFVSNCDPSAGLNFPIVRIEDCEREFPGMRRTTLKLREGTVTGGNVGLMETAAMRRALPVMRRAYALRKRPLRLAHMVGFGVLARVVLGQAVPASLPLACLERGVGRFLGVKVHAVLSRYAELGADLDKAGDYEGFLRKFCPELPQD